MLDAQSAGEAGGDGVSSLAQSVFRASTQNWVRVEHGMFHCWAGTEQEAGDTCSDAEFAWRRITGYLGQEPRGGPIRLFVVSDRALWHRVVQSADRRRDSVAVQAGDEVFILREAGQAWELPRLPHELVHVKLWRLYGRKVPLWVDEGLATYLGWHTAEAREWEQTVVLSRRKERIPEAERRSPAELQQVRSYRNVGPSFYAQVEEMIAIVVRLQGVDALGDLARKVVEKDWTWETYLDEAGLTEQQIYRLEEEWWQKWGGRRP